MLYQRLLDFSHGVESRQFRVDYQLLRKIPGIGSGVSFGGAIALEFAARCPGRIGNLVVQGAGTCAPQMEHCTSRTLDLTGVLLLLLTGVSMGFGLIVLIRGSRDI